MSIKYPILFAGIGFLLGAIFSIRKGCVLYKTGYSLERKADPFGYWAAVLSLIAAGTLGIVFGVWY